MIDDLISHASDELKQKVRDARQRVATLDSLDVCVDRDLSSILAALACGLVRPESEAAFDALVMLDDVVETSFAGEQYEQAPKANAEEIATALLRMIESTSQ